MATQQTATVYIKNLSGGHADMTLSHKNSTNGTQTGTWNNVPNTSMAGPLTVEFETGAGVHFVQDYWRISLIVKDGPYAGQYVSSGSAVDWDECQLQKADAGQTLYFQITSTTFYINIPSGGSDPAMVFLAPYSPITNVFVLMLENHSFDNIFAMSGIPDITAATPSDINTFEEQNYPVYSGAPVTMPTDPGHEFLDTFEQLTGQPGSAYVPGADYQINNSGFVSNYATTTTEGERPDFFDIGKIMACFDTLNQLPVMYQLATEFAICDHWFSSIPGPTWPNRYFLHGASSAGLDDSPSQSQLIKWEKALGFTYPNGSIYDRMVSANIQYPWRFYGDTADTYSDDPQNEYGFGGIAQVASIHSLNMALVNDLSRFASDLQQPYPYAYTFIEPNYGDVWDNTYAGGSSQHPMDDVYGGENLIKTVYEAIRASPRWNSSVLIIIYDEHGGFYDSVPPGPAPTPNDGSNGSSLNKHGFDFTQYGLRVPAVVVSPLIPKGTVDQTIYDHASVPATLERLLNFSPLTDRDAQANDLLHLFSLSTPRTDCPQTLNPPAPPVAPSVVLTPEAIAQIEQKPLPESGNAIGFLHILLKTELELSTGDEAEKAAIFAKFKTIKTFGQAKAYHRSVMAKLAIAKAVVNK